MVWDFMKYIGEGSLLYEYGKAFGTLLIENPIGIFFTWFIILYAVFGGAMRELSERFGEFYAQRLAIAFAFVTAASMAYLKVSILNLLVFGLPILYISLGYTVYNFLKGFVDEDKNNYILGFSVASIVIAFIHFAIQAAASDKGIEISGMEIITITISFLLIIAVILLLYFFGEKIFKSLGLARFSEIPKNIKKFTNIERKIEKELKDLTKFTFTIYERLFRIFNIVDTLLVNFSKLVAEGDKQKIKNYIEQTIEEINSLEKTIDRIKDKERQLIMYDEYLKKELKNYLKKNYTKITQKILGKKYSEHFLPQYISEIDKHIKKLYSQISRELIEDEEVWKKVVGVLDKIKRELGDIKGQLDEVVDSLDKNNISNARESLRVAHDRLKITRHLLEELKNAILYEEKIHKIIKEHLKKLGYDVERVENVGKGGLNNSQIKTKEIKDIAEEIKHDLKDLEKKLRNLYPTLYSLERFCICLAEKSRLLAYITTNLASKKSRANIKKDLEKFSNNIEAVIRDINKLIKENGKLFRELKRLGINYPSSTKIIRELDEITKLLEGTKQVVEFYIRLINEIEKNKDFKNTLRTYKSITGKGIDLNKLPNDVLDKLYNQINKIMENAGISNIRPLEYISVCDLYQEKLKKIVKEEEYFIKVLENAVEYHGTLKKSGINSL